MPGRSWLNKGRPHPTEAHRRSATTWKRHRDTQGNLVKDVIVVIGPGQIGQAIARRVGIGKHVLLADLRQEDVD